MQFSFEIGLATEFYNNNKIYIICQSFSTSTEDYLMNKGY